MRCSSVLCNTVLLATVVVSATPFEHFETFFSFGDSYTATTGATGDSPPLAGYSTAHETAGSTSGGLNWVQFLKARDLSKAFYNFATISATTTNAIVNTGVSSFIDQVTRFEEATPISWQADKSLFMILFGINDIGYSYLHGQWFPHLVDQILLTYEKQILRLYADGARHFLLLNVPPTHKTPLVVSYGEQSIHFFESNVAEWNRRLDHYVRHFHKRYPGATATLFDTHSLYNEILGSPAQHGIKNSSSICPSYSAINFDPLYHDPLCKFPLGAYAWVSSYHPSWRVHQLMADSVVSTLARETKNEKISHKRERRRLGVQ